jgi:hypothetical protein
MIHGPDCWQYHTTCAAQKVLDLQKQLKMAGAWCNIHNAMMWWDAWDKRWFCPTCMNAEAVASEQHTCGSTGAPV